MDTLSQTWRADAATLRRRGATVQAEVLESCAADLDAHSGGTVSGTFRASGKPLTADAIAERLGVTRQRAYELIRSGKLPGIRMGRSVRVASDALDRFIAFGGVA